MTLTLQPIRVAIGFDEEGLLVFDEEQRLVAVLTHLSDRYDGLCGFHPSDSAWCRWPADTSKWIRIEPTADRRRVMDDREEKIRARAYEIWERQGRSGSPDDHWFEAERELKAEEQPREISEDRSEATVEEAPPVEAVEALEAASDSPDKGKRSRRSSKG